MKKAVQVLLFILASVSTCAAESSDKIEIFLGTWRTDFEINYISYTRYYQFHRLDTMTMDNPLQRGPEQVEFAIAYGVELQTNNEVAVFQLGRNLFLLMDDPIVPDTIANYFLRFLLYNPQKVSGFVVLQDFNDLQDRKMFSRVEIEKVAEIEGVDDSQLKTDEEALELEEDSSLQSTLESETIEDTILLEEKIEAEKEEVIEEIVEKEAGLDDWCPECIWLGTSEYSCKDRLWWIQRFYKAKEDPGKIALMKEGCSVKDGKVRVGEKIDGSRLLRGL